MNLELSSLKLFAGATVAIAINAGCDTTVRTIGDNPFGTGGNNNADTGGAGNGGAMNTGGATVGGASGSGGATGGSGTILGGSSSVGGAATGGSGTLPGGSTSVGGGTGTGGSGGAVPCSDPGAPISTWDTPRRMLPWDLSVLGTASDAGLPTSGCARSGNFDSVSCQGVATAQGTGGTLTLVFGDSSTLMWDPALVANPVAPPNVADGGSVWVEYSKVVGVVCPNCGTYWNAKLQIRTQQGGELLWVGQEGHTLSDVSDALVNELFGVSARSQLTCALSYTAACSNVQRSLFDHVLETTPEQLVHHAALQRVTAPNGAFDVVWALSQENSTHNPSCLDGPAVASDTGFAASRLVTCSHSGTSYAVGDYYSEGCTSCVCQANGTWGMCTGACPDPHVKTCVDSGGTATSGLCCAGLSADFPNTCDIGPRSCSPENSKILSICQCPSGRCFNGNVCVTCNNGTTC
jgi:hypothetical protein